ncbi:MAG: 8-amino-7-oxononanoate synthase [Nitrospirae bacterium CG_4_10_14_0_8_um_filter_41_23]|nr:pyridoxal phosphate-dependent aminotransferase family protein [Nitrospirota bacterium]PIQ93468.1 MAG: 8-amino-7-oxononanoate synthase [Nitrospirae bacterium CG11_big_fil_rev_8_21_14_0_20_41_14]PIV44847.1 MAG: 8-amino-7-oxononanoate synthase [Nitrospirae bacterium CG02_land_8_20_14_3_00_41_53]PIW86623.1 MAG: 8-amino-7-oxononanoate synthase [Nitrospirae bacterium CG_4_8_14_3_um_filter_41_47]PIY87757.1 MAG: 8-amino-7-oxononanoate synthase [Nitrospirae bacterium CG_4_10_14_0_8_um_filter_41_23]P
MDSRLVQDSEMAVKKSTDIFDKCFRFDKAKSLISHGLYPYFRVIESAQDPEIIMNGRKMIMVGSNNYLGLTNHPKVKEAAIEAIKKYGTGCAGSRFLNGTLDIHVKLEEKLAGFIRKEAALIFSTGFQVNLGVISALVGKDDVVIIDKMDHASIIDGCRLSFGEVKKFKHNDMADLERLLTEYEDKDKLIVVDGVFSMEGDIANLPEIVALAKKYGARTMVDDAHSIGVLGKTGRGTAEHFGLEDEVDLIMGTYSKSLASIGGFISGSADVIHYIKHSARSLIFSASPPPASVASVSAAVDIIENEPERRETLWKNTRKMLKGFKDLGFEVGPSQTPIIPIVVGEDEKAFIMAMMLQEEGVFANVAVSPAVPNGRALIRTSYMATHTDEHLDIVLKAFEKVGRKLGIIG